MKITLLNIFITLLFLSFISGGCVNDSSNSDNNAAARNSNSNTNSSSENTNSSADDLDELEKIIKLPLMPEEANYWTEKTSDSENQNAPASGKTFVAVLKFSQADAAQLVNHLQQIKQPIESDIDTDSRFPAELIAQSQLSGDETLKGMTYAADDFIQPPYKTGKITRINETNYFILELNSK